MGNCEKDLFCTFPTLGNYEKDLFCTFPTLGNHEKDLFGTFPTLGNYEQDLFCTFRSLGSAGNNPQSLGERPAVEKINFLLVVFIFLYQILKIVQRYNE